MNFWERKKKKNLNSLENSISLTVKQVFVSTVTVSDRRHVKCILFTNLIM